MASDAIAEYVLLESVGGDLAYRSARRALLDALASALTALQAPACARLLGPIVPGATMAGGARVPGTSYELDPAQAAFNIGTLICWHDCHGARLAAECGPPSASLGGILAVADYLSRKFRLEGRRPLGVRDVLTATIKAYEVHGTLASTRRLDDAGFDTLAPVRVASAAVVAAMLGGGRAQITTALSNAWLDGGAPHESLHGANAGSRNIRIAGDATARAVRHAFAALADDADDTETPLAGKVELGDTFILKLDDEGDEPVLRGKLEAAVAGRFSPRQAERILALFADPAKLDELPFNELMAALVRN